MTNDYTYNLDTLTYDADTPAWYIEANDDFIRLLNTLPCTYIDDRKHITNFCYYNDCDMIIRWKGQLIYDPYAQ